MAMAQKLGVFQPSNMWLLLYPQVDIYTVCMDIYGYIYMDIYGDLYIYGYIYIWIYIYIY